MRILQLCGAGSVQYGASVSYATLCKGLQDIGEDVTAGYLIGKYLGGDMRDRGLPTLEVPIRRKIDPRGIGCLVRLLREHQFDAMQVHMSTACINGGIAGRLARVPTATTVHGLSNVWSYRWGHHIISVSEQVRRHLRSQGMREDRVSTVHNGIVIEPFLVPEDRAIIRKQYGLEGTSFVVGMTCRVVWAKGFRVILEAMPALVAAIPDFVLWVLGDGANFGEIKATFAEWVARGVVRFEGYQPVLPALWAMDAYLLPSESEALPMSIIEAMAARLPVVATRVGGIPEIVDETTGILIDPGDAKGLSQALAEVNRTDSTTLGDAGHRRVLERFSHRHMAQRTVEVLRSIRP
ncbi:MAG: D-inositol-3-phosphate glycosyltransferase [Fimbriimonadaceae bacterium]|nr:D-inositol-3-phosphate glycosyltransferase [Fimbriimonadaceae bacterium]